MAKDYIDNQQQRQLEILTEKINRILSLAESHDQVLFGKSTTKGLVEQVSTLEKDSQERYNSIKEDFRMLIQESIKDCPARTTLKEHLKQHEKDLDTHIGDTRLSKELSKMNISNYIQLGVLLLAIFSLVFTYIRG